MNQYMFNPCSSLKHDDIKDIKWERIATMEYGAFAEVLLKTAEINDTSITFINY